MQASVATKSSLFGIIEHSRGRHRRQKYGTDALRFVMASLCTDNQDVRLPVKKEKQPDGREINTSDKCIG